MVEIFRLLQNMYLHRVMAVLVSEVILKGLHLKIVLPLLNASRWLKKMHACKTQTVI